MLKLPSHFLRQHGGKIRDGLVVLKLVSSDPDADPTLNLNLNSSPIFLTPKPKLHPKA